MVLATTEKIEVILNYGETAKIKVNSGNQDFFHPFYNNVN